MDREIAPEVRQRRIVKRVATIVLATAAVAFFFAASLQWLRPSIRRRDVRLARVERGTVEATLQASGTIVPQVEQVVSSPVEARVLRVVHRAGDRVQAGDELLTLDTAASRLDAERLDERVTQKESATTQLRLQLDETVATLRAQLEQKKLDVEINHYTAEQRTKLKAAGLVAEQDALAAVAAARKTDIELRQIEAALVRAQRSAAVQLSSSQQDLSIAKREHEESRRQLELAMMRADRDGVVTWTVNDVGATVRRGDILARIADLSSYRVEAAISEVHASSVAAGMRTRVQLDDRTTIGGTIATVDPRIANGVVRFFVTLDEPSHARLRNSMRADVQVVTAHRNNVLRARRGTLGDKNQLFVVRGDELVRVPVRFGLSGDQNIELASGVAEGSEIVISDMSDYEDVTRLRLR
jgi:HlyD family secretion protein